MRRHREPATGCFRCGHAEPGRGDNPNRIDVKRLNDIDRRLLKESLRAARSLQQRLQMDYQR